MFEDRTDAGRLLAENLTDEAIDADLVLAIPRGGLPVGRPVADALGVPLDVVVARKIGSPGNPELAIGAVAADGSCWLNDGLIDRLGVGDRYIERKREHEAEAARDKRERYRSGEPPRIEGRTVVLVDDGVATGATMRACVEQLLAADAERIVLAVPVGEPGTLAKLGSLVDEVVALERPHAFGSVGQHYQSFDQVPDSEAMTYLDDE